MLGLLRATTGPVLGLLRASTGPVLGLLRASTGPVLGLLRGLATSTSLRRESLPAARMAWSRLSTSAVVEQKEEAEVLRLAGGPRPEGRRSWEEERGPPGRLV